MKRIVLAAFAAALCCTCGQGVRSSADEMVDGALGDAASWVPRTSYIVLDDGRVLNLNNDDTWRSRPPLQRVLSLCDASGGDSLVVGSFHIRRDAIREVHLAADDIWGVNLIPYSFLGGCVGLEKLAADFPTLPKSAPASFQATQALRRWSCTYPGFWR